MEIDDAALPPVKVIHPTVTLVLAVSAIVLFGIVTVSVFPFFGEPG
jgi:hypothetical protein